MPPVQMTRLLRRGRYRLFLAWHPLLEEMVGYACVFDPPAIPVLWLDYMAIEPRFRSAGYGTLLFNRLAQIRPDALGMVFEVEPVDALEAGQRAEQERRIAFYRRLGAQCVTDQYQFPNADGGRPMGLWVRLSPGVKILPAEVSRKAVMAAFDTLHADVPQRDRLLREILPHIADAHAPSPCAMTLSPPVGQQESGRQRQ
ncbi:protein of unknown function [Candidatus Hydrogenisulfobacillus filiaventi]|uniref:N-acetyltransferase domain-containing protein n=1 Tax=Candidatus Hydrogenisulfobacillus filiaventi TaxID=2707344 RepID=A0A6F8ZI11_9FIRM|nr:protein of unknown function [Candidatus Hydrogenisulfobacillus filiaventi]